MPARHFRVRHHHATHHFLIAGSAHLNRFAAFEVDGIAGVPAHHRGADDFGADKRLSGRLHAHDRHKGADGWFPTHHFRAGHFAAHHFGAGHVGAGHFRLGENRGRQQSGKREGNGARCECLNFQHGGECAARPRRADM